MPFKGFFSITIIDNIAFFNILNDRNVPTNNSLVSNFRLILKVVFFLLGNSLVSEFYVPTFRNTQSIPKRRRIIFRRRRINQKKTQLTKSRCSPV